MKWIRKIFLVECVWDTKQATTILRIHVLIGSIIDVYEFVNRNTEHDFVQLYIVSINYQKQKYGTPTKNKQKKWLNFIIFIFIFFSFIEIVIVIQFW